MGNEVITRKHRETDAEFRVRQLEAEILSMKTNKLKEVLYRLGIKSAKPHPTFRVGNAGGRVISFMSDNGEVSMVISDGTNWHKV